MEKPLKISDLVKATGLNRSTIHYYRNENLISEPIKTAKTMAYYTKKHVAELEEIIRLKDAGYPISFIKKMVLENREKRVGLPEGSDNSDKAIARIIEEAIESFAGIGYYATDMDDLAKRVGIDEGLIYLYFPDKESLFKECIDWTFRVVFKEVWNEVKEEQDPLVRTYKSALYILTYYSKFADFLHELDRMAKTGDTFAEKRKEFFESSSMLLKTNLQKAHELGVVGPIDMALVSHFCIGIAEGGARLLDMEESYTPEDYLQAALRIFKLATTPGVDVFLNRMIKE